MCCALRLCWTTTLPSFDCVQCVYAGSEMIFRITATKYFSHRLGWEVFAHLYVLIKSSQDLYHKNPGIQCGRWRGHYLFWYAVSVCWKRPLPGWKQTGFWESLFPGHGFPSQRNTPPDPFLSQSLTRVSVLRLFKWRIRQKLDMETLILQRKLCPVVYSNTEIKTTS